MKQRFMKMAINQAIAALSKGEVPIGAVIVRDDKVIAKAHNLRQTKQIATYHAEVLAIDKACKKLKSWRLDECEMYVTLEPCIMCAGAITNARLKKVYFGAYEPNGGACESRFKLLSEGVLNHTTEFEGGVMQEECSKLITDFFKKRRAENSTAQSCNNK